MKPEEGGSPEVSVIIVNWNGERFIHDCFDALKAQSFRDFEVVFVDNASSDNSVALARELIPGLGFSVKLVELAENTGFTGGNNEGLRHCSGRYIALLNNDTVASEGWLEALVRAMDAHPEVGICASKLIVAGTDIIDSAGDGVFSNLRTFKRGMGEPAASYDKEEYVFSACAGAALYRRQMIDEIGFLDDDFFLLAEDVDLGFRAQLAGWKSLYVPQSVIQHKVGASIKKLSGAAIKHSVRNERILIAKNVPLSLLLKHLPLYVLEEIVFSIRHHLKSHTLRAYVKGNYEFIRALPRHLAKRKRIMRTRKGTDSYIESFLVPVLPFYKEKLKRKAANMFHGRSRRASAVREEPGPSSGKPRIAIGMPVYNGERYLREALDSLLAQTYRHFLLHISDDASTDATAEICREYAGRDERVSYHRHERNVGITANFNHALGCAADSDYFMWAAQDDWWAPEYLERCLKAMEGNPEVVFCSSKTVLSSPEGRVFGRDDFDFTTVGKAVTGRVKHYLNNVGVYNSLFYGLIRSSALRGKSLINLMGQDHLLMVQLLLEGDIRIVDAYLFKKTIGGGTSAHIRKFASLYGITNRLQIDWHHANRFIHYVPALVYSPRIKAPSKIGLLSSLTFIYLKRYFYHDLTAQKVFRRVKRLAYLQGKRRRRENVTVLSKILILLSLPLIHLRHFLLKNMKMKKALGR